MRANRGSPMAKRRAREGPPQTPIRGILRQKHESKLLVLTGACLVLACATIVSRPDTAQKQPEGTAPFRWPQGKRAAISLTFDDARRSQVDTGLPLLDRYKVKATFYVSPDNVKERLDGWRRAVKNGHEIGNHTMTHPCTGNYAFSKANALEDLTLDRMAREIDEATRTIEKLLAVRPVSFAYPCCQTFVGRGKAVKSYVPLVAKRFLTARLGFNEAANDPGICDLVQLLAQGSDGAAFEELKALIDQAVSDGRWLILFGHEVGNDGDQTTPAKTLEALCRYATDPVNSLWIDTVGRIGKYVADNRK
jgi:peptidoglycan/xylan/chitin deacetylase (PgdA/CDA1 family)